MPMSSSIYIITQLVVMVFISGLLKALTKLSVRRSVKEKTGQPLLNAKVLEGKSPTGLL